MRHYAVYTSQKCLRQVLAFVREHALRYEIHMVRTRVWIPEGELLTLFLLQFGHCCEELPL